MGNNCPLYFFCVILHAKLGASFTGSPENPSWLVGFFQQRGKAHADSSTHTSSLWGPLMARVMQWPHHQANPLTRSEEDLLPTESAGCLTAHPQAECWYFKTYRFSDLDIT